MALSDYEILGRVEWEGMGLLYRAQRRTNNEAVLVEQTANVPVGIERVPFGDEGVRVALPFWRLDQNRARLEAVALLRHPNILPVVEFGVDARFLYVVRPYVEAVFLDRMTTPPPRQAAHLVGQVAGAVQHANEHGIFHRDIKPANVLVAGDVPLLVGFNCAHVRFLYPPIEQERSDTIVGTPAFMAPEVALGKSGDAWAAVDIWGLGALLFTLLTGRPPFLAPTVVEWGPYEAPTVLATLLAAIKHGPPSVRSLNPAIDPDLETICLKCLRKDPAQRYPEAREVAEDLARYLAGEPIGQAQRPSLGGRLRGWVRGWLGG